MITQTVECDGVVVEIERANPRKAPTRRAQYMYALTKTYPMLNDLTSTPGVMIWGEIAPFIEAAVRIKTIAGAPFKQWPDPNDHKAVAAAYDWWCEESRQKLADLIEKTYVRLENPNGNEGKPGSELDASQRADPLSETPDENSKPDSESD